MKKRILFFIFIFTCSANAQDVVEQLGACLEQAKTTDAKRKCVATCYDGSSDMFDRDDCVYADSETEKAEYMRLLKVWMVRETESTASEDQYESGYAGDTLSRLANYSSNLPKFIVSKCSLTTLSMQGGSGESNEQLYCEAQSYKEASAFLKENGHLEQ